MYLQVCLNKLYVVLVVFAIYGCIATGVNIALNRPAYSSSIHDTSLNDVGPENAVDGNSDRNINNDHCMTTNMNDSTPWWLVDLGQPYHIDNITIVNRGDSRRDYLHDFYIEMFVDQPDDWSSAAPTQCLYYDAILYNIETLTCDNPVDGRYVRIRKIPRGTKTHLFLCEVEIRGTLLAPSLHQDCVDQLLPYQTGKRMQTNITQNSVTSMHLADCVVTCRYNATCRHVNYNTQTRQCHMITLTSQQDVLVLDADWTYVPLP